MRHIQLPAKPDTTLSKYSELVFTQEIPLFRAERQREKDARQQIMLYLHLKNKN